MIRVLCAKEGTLSVRVGPLLSSQGPDSTRTSLDKKRSLLAVADRATANDRLPSPIKQNSLTLFGSINQLHIHFTLPNAPQPPNKAVTPVKRMMPPYWPL